MGAVGKETALATGEGVTVLYENLDGLSDSPAGMAAAMLPECSDMIPNDAVIDKQTLEVVDDDGTDWPADPDCENPEDDSESE